MLRSCFHTCLIALHLLWIAGCGSSTTTENVVVHENSFEPDKPYEHISSIVLLNGEVIRFDDMGAFVQHGSFSVKGRTTSGEQIDMNWNDVDEYRMIRPETMTVGANINRRIGEVVLKEGNRLLRFNENGARYFPESRSILGYVGSSRATTEISVDRILEARPLGLQSQKAAQLVRATTVAEIITKASRTSWVFDERGGTLSEDARAQIVGRTRDGTVVIRPFSDVLHARIEVTNVALGFVKVIGALLLLGAVIFLIALASKQSCPFVYSYNGSTYVFDAEPLGGAISRGLAKTDVSRLEHIVDADGLYKLLVRNEVKETQMLDEMSLLVLDHAEGTEVVPTEQGEFFQFSNIISPSDARDERGRDLLPFLSRQDDTFWQTQLPRTDSERLPGTRHTITMTFPKPANAKDARIIFRGGTALWGSNMIRSMLSLRGDGLPDWYAAVDRKGPEYGELVEFVVREELYVLKAYVRTEKGLDLLAYLPGGGPLVYEDRAVPVDLRQIPGDSLTIEIHPPYGFWGIDFFGISYESPEVLRPTVLSAIEDRSATDTAVERAVRATDNIYHPMPEVGDAFNLAFPAPERVEGMKRTVYLKTSGYYTLHIDTTQAEQTELVRQLLRTPGKIVDYAMDAFVRYATSLSEQTAEPERR